MNAEGAASLPNIDAAEQQPSLEIQPMALDAQIIAKLSQPNLWHLSKAWSGAARFSDAWTQGVAHDVTIGVVDEGINYLHADLAGAYDVTIDYDPRDAGEHDALPDSTSHRHGTNVAGLLAGDINNDIGTVGGAQGGQITGSYLRYGQQFDLAELAAIIGHQANYDISNNSWGFTQAFADNFFSGQFAETAAALETVVAEGRDGYGTVMVFAAGNGKIETVAGNIGDDANFHNLQNSRFVVAVGAHDISGAPAYFSSPGTNLLLTAPGVSLLTTHGTTPGSAGAAYVSGTSFAAPLVSSAVALMLTENPNLGYRDVQEILVLSSTPRLDGHSAENGFGGFNGGGLLFDREGGFGRLDAGAAAALARNWSHTSTLADEQELAFFFQPGVTLDPNHAVLQAELTNPGTAGFSIDWVQLDLTIFDSNLKELRIDLVSPAGTRATIAENFSAAGSKTYLNFSFTSAMTWGEDPYGTWQIEFVHDNAPENFAVYRADVHVYGDVDIPDDTYFYTDSFSDLVAQDAIRAHAIDGDGGIDTLNFAAGRDPLYLDLSGQTTSSFDNETLYIDGEFENAIGTAAADALLGSAVANHLSGDFGNDDLRGGDGDDTLLGGADNDTLDGGSGNDTIDGGAGTGDTYLLSKAFNGYTITLNAEVYTIVDDATSETDTVTNVENFDFNGTVANVTGDANAIVTNTAPIITSIVEAGPDEDSNSNTLTVDEHSLNGTVVATVTASDPNIAAGENLAFSLRTGGGAFYTGPFSIAKITPTTAKIRVNGPLDFEDDDNHAFFVRVTDGENHIDREPVAVSVNDLNEAPIILIGGAGADNLIGGLDTDTADYSKSGAAVSIDLILGSGVGGHAQGDTLNRIENVVGGVFGDTITGDGNHNKLVGLGANDELYGNEGDDTLIGGAGADKLSGGTGQDVVDYSSSPAGVSVDLVARTGAGGDAQGDNHFGNMDDVIGSAFDDTITGDAAPNRLLGSTGDDELYGNEGNDTLVGGAGADKLSGGTGQDVADYSHSPAGVAVDLLTRTGQFGDAHGDHHFGNIDDLTGSAFGDQLSGDDANNRLTGLAGEDELLGRGGADTLFGGGAADQFIYVAVGDSLPGSFDVIGDFSTAEKDKIVLFDIDADTASGGNQAFTYIGNGAFTGIAGQLRFAGGFVEGDVDGNAVADLRIQVNVASLVASDFIL
jgi:subtilisin-like proprotein convertase family protein